MGLCCSSGIKIKVPFHQGVNPKSSGKGMRKISRKISSATVPSTLQTEGQGGFGMVFKGWIDNYALTAPSPKTGTVIAVKMLKKNGSQGQQEWLTEIKYLGQLYHPNLVKLIGYCIEDDKRLLVYEFMPNNSLEHHLFRRSPHFQPLSWNLRMKIALGVAKGLAFLHDEAQVIYRDIKTSNILLDWNYNAKLSDFGFAKDGPTGDKSHLTASILGTCGYLAPEYLNKGHLTTKADVYSFGVILLEMISGRPATDEHMPSTEQNLVEWAKPYLIRKCKVFLLLDASIEGKYALRGALKAVDLAVQCLSVEPKLRPSVKEVVKALEQIYYDL